jgi:hypothetical protein
LRGVSRARSQEREDTRLHRLKSSQGSAVRLGVCGRTTFMPRVLADPQRYRAARLAPRDPPSSFA